ncbi:MAG: YeeE/YedE thiosulfate transporter family protein [Sedimenticola sp.]
MSFTLLLLVGLFFGVGFGFFTQRAGLCFAHGLGEIFIGKGKRILRMFLTIFIITGIGFLLTGYLHPELGLKPVGQIRGFGFYNLLAGIFFGFGIFLNGGCVLGTLRQIGEGNMAYVITMLSFIPGMLVVTHVLNPLLSEGYSTQQVLLPELLGIPAPYVMGALALASLVWFLRIRRRKGG